MTLLLAGAASVPAVGATPAGAIDFNRDIRPLLSDRCYKCHGPDENQRKGDLRLDLEEDAKVGAIVPGMPEESEFMARISSTDPEVRMPPAESGKSLSKKEIELLRQWIGQGAKWQKHWSLIAPQRSAPSEIKLKSAAANAIDRFIVAQLERDGLRVSSTLLLHMKLERDHAGRSTG